MRAGKTAAWAFGVAALALVSSAGAQSTQTQTTKEQSTAKKSDVRPPAPAATTGTSDTGTTTPAGTTGPDMRRRLDQIRNEESDEVKRVPVAVPGAKIPPPTDVTSAQSERHVPPPEPREDRPATLPL